MKPWRIDPLKYCTYFKKYGCSHVDGYLCDILTCNIFIDFEKTLSRYKKIDKILNRKNIIK